MNYSPKCHQNICIVSALHLLFCKTNHNQMKDCCVWWHWCFRFGKYYWLFVFFFSIFLSFVYVLIKPLLSKMTWNEYDERIQLRMRLRMNYCSKMFVYAFLFLFSTFFEFNFLCVVGCILSGRCFVLHRPLIDM